MSEDKKENAANDSGYSVGNVVLGVMAGFNFGSALHVLVMDRPLSAVFFAAGSAITGAGAFAPSIVKTLSRGKSAGTPKLEQ